jgi:hypothetical protein
MDKTDEFIKKVKTQLEINLKKYEGKENIQQLLNVCMEELGEITKDVNDGKLPSNDEIIDLGAVLLQIFMGKIRRKIIAFVGSARFHQTFIDLEKIYTFQEYTVLLPFWNGMTRKDEYSSEEWEYLMGYSYNKIDLADYVLVVNVDGYIGEHTTKEIEYAKSKNKIILYHNPLFKK